MVECQTRNRESPDSNPHLLPFWSFGIFVLSTTLQFTQPYKWVPGYRRWWKCEWILFARCCSIIECFSQNSSRCRNEHVCQGVKHFEWYDGMDTALFKIILLPLMCHGKATNKYRVCLNFALALKMATPIHKRFTRLRIYSVSVTSDIYEI